MRGEFLLVADFISSAKVGLLWLGSLSAVDNFIEIRGSYAPANHADLLRDALRLDLPETKSRRTGPRDVARQSELDELIASS